MKNKILNCLKENGGKILFLFFVVFIFMGMFIFIYINDLLIIKNYYFLVTILLFSSYFSFDFACLVLKLCQRNKNKVNDDNEK